MAQWQKLQELSSENPNVFRRVSEILKDTGLTTEVRNELAEWIESRIWKVNNNRLIICVISENSHYGPIHFKTLRYKQCNANNVKVITQIYKIAFSSFYRSDYKQNNRSKTIFKELIEHIQIKESDQDTTFVDRLKWGQEKQKFQVCFLTI